MWRIIENCTFEIFYEASQRTENRVLNFTEDTGKDNNVSAMQLNYSKLLKL